MSSLPTPGRTVLVQGPCGSGKSSVIRSALKEWGSGVVLMAPGDEEANSFTEFYGREGYLLKGFNDHDFLPSLGMWKADGHQRLLRTLHGLSMRCRWDLGLMAEVMTDAQAKLNDELQKKFGDPLGELKYKGLGLDTMSGVGILAVNAMQSVTTTVDAPPAQHPDGARYYLGIASKLEEVMRMLDALKGYGMDVIATTHVREKDAPATSMAEDTGKRTWVPAIVGGFRDVMPRAFDVGFHAGVDGEAKLVDGRNDSKQPKYYLMWVSGKKKPTKSRVGPLASTVAIPNEWEYISAAIDMALARRAERG